MTVGSSATAEQSEEEDVPLRDGHETDSDHDRVGDETRDAPRGLPKDVVFGLLSAKWRRRVLEYMDEYDETTTLSDLADHIAALENDTEIRLLSSQERKRVYVALYQSHLPKLDDADVIDFDHSQGTVERRPEADQLYAYLEIDQMAASENEARTDTADADDAAGEWTNDPTVSDEWDEIGYVSSSRYRVTVLRQLAAGPATPSRIAAESDPSIAHISRALGELREHSLVTLLVSEDRKKGRIYGITEKGEAIWEEIELRNLNE